MVAFRSKLALLGLAAVQPALARKLNAPSKSSRSSSSWTGAFRPITKGLGFLTAFTGATSAIADPYSSEALQMKYAASQDELENLLASKDNMKAGFSNFMANKYGDSAASKYLGDAESDFTSSPKYLAFQYNVQLAHERNLRSGGKVVHGITGLMDLTRDEFRGMLGYKPAAEKDMEKVKMLKLEPDDGEEVNKDWRDEGAVTKVKDQGQCGSCWAFSTVESMESAALVQGLFDKDDPFIGAPQELVSCDTHGQDQGCNGGLPENAFKYFKKVPLEPESDYPYTSGITKKDGFCKLDKSEGVLEVTKSTPTSIWGIGETQDMKDWISTKGPMSVAVHANDEWQTYTGGVMDKETCPDEQPNHAVQAVALNTGDGYWVIRNSWNTNWGEDGYIRLTYGENTCSVAFEGYGVEVKRVDQEAAASSSSPKIEEVSEEEAKKIEEAKRTEMLTV